MPGSISFRKIPVFLAGAWESLSVDSELSALEKKQPACPVPRPLLPSLGLGQLGCVAGIFWVESLGKRGTHLPLGMPSLILAALVLPLQTPQKPLGIIRLTHPKLKLGQAF